MTAPVVASEVTFAYPERRSPALDGVSLEVPEGSFALVTGSTGSGKSTLLRAMNGLVPHFSGGRFSGRVLLHGTDTVERPPRRLSHLAAFVPQDPGTAFVVDRVEDELAYGLENLGASPAVMRRRVEEALALLDIEHLRDRSARDLSGGERQRVAIAAALAAGPRTLLLDEPTSQLDPQGAEDVLAALARLVDDLGMTVILAEHRLERVAGFADLALGCRAGRVASGDPASILDALGSGPPVTVLGRALGWSPPPLTVRQARRWAAALPPLTAPRAVGAPAPPPILEARSLWAGYDRPVLRGLDLRVARGEALVLVGRNGAGKTTLLRCLVGLHRPLSGGVACEAGAVRRGIDVALCPQAPESALFCSTVRAEVRATLEARRRPERPEKVLEALGIADLADSHPRDLSAGERLLVAVAAIAATGAPVLLLDEPTRGLDPASKRRLLHLLRAHCSAGGAVVLATHDVELAAAAADRVAMLAGGEVIAQGPPGEVLGASSVFAPQMARIFGPGWLTPDQVVAAVAGAR